MRKIKTLFPEIQNKILKLKKDEKTVLQKSEIVLREMFRIFKSTGPSDILKGKEMPSEIFQKIINHGAAVQCTGTRNLFI